MEPAWSWLSTPCSGRCVSQGAGERKGDSNSTSRSVPRSSPGLGARPFDRPEPAGVQALALVLGHSRDEAGLDPMVLGDLRGVLPEANGESGQVGRAQRGRFRYRGTLRRHAEHVGLELAEEAV